MKIKKRVAKLESKPEKKAPIRTEEIAKRIPKFNLVSVFNGQRKIIGFNLTRYDAQVLETVARKKIRKVSENGADGSPLFELTELVAERA